MATQNGPISRYSLRAEGSGVAQRVQQLGSPHVLEVDLPPAFGGKDVHPGPLPTALAALTSCSQITAHFVARELGIVVESMTFDLESAIDLSLLMGLPAPARPDFQSIDVQVTLRTRADADAIRRLQAETERRCPVFQLFTRAGVPIRSEWVVVNG